MEPVQRTTEKSNFFKTLSFRLSSTVGISILIFTTVVAFGASLIFNNYATTSATSQAQALSDTMAVNYDNYFTSVIAVSNHVASTLYNVTDPVASSETLSQDFDSILAVKTDIASIAVYSYDGSSCYAHDSVSKPLSSVNREDWYLKTIADPTLNVFTSGFDHYFVLSKVVTYDKGASSSVLSIQVSSLATSIYQVDLGVGGRTLIYDKNYETVYDSTGEAVSSEVVATLKKGVFGYERASLNGHSFYIGQYTIANTTWRLAIIQNFDALQTASRRFVLVISLSALVFFLLSITVLTLVSKSVTKPLKTLQESMKTIEDNGYRSYEPVVPTGSIEIQDLSRNYNEMMLRIKTLNDDVIAEQNAQRLSELHALQNQINPHFLYNTLDSIVFLIDSGKSQEASDMVVALSRFFRISISKGRNVIPLSDEVEHVRNYLLIQKIRYKDSFEYSINVDPSLGDLKIIKLILQPIVENAIQHGLLNKEGVGRIAIEGKMEGDLLVLSVKDNGYGIMPEKIEEIYSSFRDKNVYNGVGLKNVYQRLKIYFGDKADVKISSELDEGTTVTLIVPVKERKIYED
jgi:two-component system sensor histidine kinase YesM